MSLVETTDPPPRPVKSLWWLHPFWVLVAPVVLFSTIAYLLPETGYRDNWRTAKSFDLVALVLCYAVAASFSAGVLGASRLESAFSRGARVASAARDLPVGLRDLTWLFNATYVVTLVAYVIWFGMIFKQGGGLGMLASVLSGGRGVTDELKKIAADSMISGITTFIQLGMGTTLIGLYVGYARGWKVVRLRLLFLLGIVMVRALFFSERLSLVEVLLPSIILLLRLSEYGQGRPLLRKLLLVGPLLGPVAVFSLFTVTEYFRSWTTYSESQDQPLLVFSFFRLAGYYVTALNNGAVEWHAYGPLNFPYTTMEWLWKFPVVGNWLQASFGGVDDPAANRALLLAADANIEFNNPSGIFVIFTDFGVFGALVLFAFYGVIARLLYGSYRRGSIIGLLLYSLLFVGMSEQVRIFYLSTGRTFPAWVLLSFAAILGWPRLRRPITFWKNPARTGGAPA